MEAWTKLRIGTLGGPGTFAGQAAERFSASGRLTYFTSAEDEWQALASGDVDALVMLVESSTSGFGELARRASAPDFAYYVLAEQDVPYGCLLLAKPGSTRITRILGHGSVAQCKAYLDRYFAGVEIVAERTSSLDAARKVASGDGSLAVVGTARTAEEFGLEVLARDVDGGTIGRYWLVGRAAAFDQRPTGLVLSGRCRAPGTLSQAILALAHAGFAVRSLAAWPSGAALFEYDYLLRLSGRGALASVSAAAPSFRLVGAFA